MVILQLIHALKSDFSSRRGRTVLIRFKPTLAIGLRLIHDNFSNRMTLRRRWFIQISALSTFDCSVLDYNGFNG